MVVFALNNATDQCFVLLRRMSKLDSSCKWMEKEYVNCQYIQSPSDLLPLSPLLYIIVLLSPEVTYNRSTQRSVPVAVLPSERVHRTAWPSSPFTALVAAVVGSPLLMLLGDIMMEFPCFCCSQDYFFNTWQVPLFKTAFSRMSSQQRNPNYLSAMVLREMHHGSTDLQILF